MTSVVDKYFRRIIQNINNVRMKFDISELLVKSKEHDFKIETNKNNISENLTLINSKFETNKNNISENLTLINSKSDIIETNKNNISENLTLINSNENRLDNIENDIVNINTKVTNNYNITQIDKKNIDFKTGIIDNQIIAINSTLNNLRTKNFGRPYDTRIIYILIWISVMNTLYVHCQTKDYILDIVAARAGMRINKVNFAKNNNSKYSIENFFIYNIEIENTYTLNSNDSKFSIFNYDLEDDFQKDSMLEINARLLYDYNSYNNIGKLIHNYKLYDAENILFHEFKSLKSNAGDNSKDDLSQIDLFYVKLNKDYDVIKIDLDLSMIEGVTGSVSCKLYNTFNSNFYV